MARWWGPYSPLVLSPLCDARRQLTAKSGFRFGVAALNQHKGHKGHEGHQGKTTSFPFVSFVSIVFDQRSGPTTPTFLVSRRIGLWSRLQSGILRPQWA